MAKGQGGLRERRAIRRAGRRDRGFRLISRTGARVVAADMIRDSSKRCQAALPSLFTLANMLCGFSAILLSIAGEYRTAAVLIGVSIILDICDGAVARAVGQITPFGLQFDSLADLVSFGMAPAVLAFSWSLGEARTLGWIACFAWLAAAAIRLARFNVTIDPMADKRFFTGLPSPGAAGAVIATIFAFDAPTGHYHRMAALLVMLVPAVLMVTSFRFRSFRSLVTPRDGRPYPLVGFALVLIAGFALEPAATGLTLAYGYVCLPLLGWLTAPVRHRLFGEEPPAPLADEDDADDLDDGADLED